MTEQDPLTGSNASPAEGSISDYEASFARAYPERNIAEDEDMGDYLDSMVMLGRLKPQDEIDAAGMATAESMVGIEKDEVRPTFESPRYYDVDDRSPADAVTYELEGRTIRANREAEFYDQYGNKVFKIVPLTSKERWDPTFPTVVPEWYLKGEQGFDAMHLGPNADPALLHAERKEDPELSPAVEVMAEEAIEDAVGVTDPSETVAPSIADIMSGKAEAAPVDLLGELVSGLDERFRARDKFNLESYATTRASLARMSADDPSRVALDKIRVQSWHRMQPDAKAIAEKYAIIWAQRNGESKAA